MTTCTQNFIVYDKEGIPVVGKWTVHVEVTEKDTGDFIEEKTCTVSANGTCSIELTEGTWIKAHATRNSETTTSYGSPACFTDTIDLWQYVNCNNPTPNHASGREMLVYWDSDKDGIITRSDVIDALGEYFSEGAIKINECMFIVVCYDDYAGIIDDMCPLKSWWGKYGKALAAGTFVLALGAIAKVTIDSITKKIRR